MHSFLWLLPFLFHAQAKTVTHNWEISWLTACPDGFCRPVIGINGAWPCPILEADLGDTVVLNIKNKLGNETTTIHPHGENCSLANFKDVTNRLKGFCKRAQMRWTALQWSPNVLYQMEKVLLKHSLRILEALVGTTAVRKIFLAFSLPSNHFYR
jgi:hypothetical protein